MCLLLCAGFKLKDNSYSHIELCEKGRVSFWQNNERVPADGLGCAACSSLDALLGTKQFAHTYAPRKGACMPSLPGCCWIASPPCLPRLQCPPSVADTPPHLAPYPAGMLTCASCPAGTAPLDDGTGATTSCAPCASGTYRTIHDIR
jgi:hypothetical protein